MDAIIVICAKYLLLLVVLGAGAAWLKTANRQKLRFLATIVLAGVIAYVLAKCASKLYYDPRPFVAEHIRPLIPHAADNGFPSDHALLTATLTATTYFFSKKIATLMAILTAAVGIARIAAHVHSPLDIAGGWAFGIAGAVASYYLVTWYWNRRAMANAQSDKQ